MLVCTDFLLLPCSLDYPLSKISGLESGLRPHLRMPQLFFLIGSKKGDNDTDNH